MLTTDWAKSNPNNLVVPILDVLRYDETFGFIVMPRYTISTYSLKCKSD